MSAPKRHWIMNGDEHGIGSDVRRYQSTRAAVQGWNGYRRPGGRMVLMTTSGPLEMTAEFEKLTWPDRELFVGDTETPVTADPDQQSNYEHHMTVCLADQGEVQKILAKRRSGRHTCAWTEYAETMHQSYLKDIAHNAEIIERVLLARSAY